MPKKICYGTFTTYPGGGAWSISPRDLRFGEFEMIQLTNTLTDEEREQKIQEAGPKAQKFLRLLLAIPNIGSYIMLSTTSFTFSMKNHREASGAEFRRLHKKVRKAFCMVYQYKKLLWA